MKTESYDLFLQEELRDPELAAAYLNAAMAEGSREIFLIALRNVAEAYGGIGAVADAADLNRQSMYRTLSSEGNPTLTTLLNILKAVGLDLSFTPTASTPTAST